MLGELLVRRPRRRAATQFETGIENRWTFIKLNSIWYPTCFEVIGRRLLVRVGIRKVPGATKFFHVGLNWLSDYLNTMGISGMKKHQIFWKTDTGSILKYCFFSTDSIEFTRQGFQIYQIINIHHWPLFWVRYASEKRVTTLLVSENYIVLENFQVHPMATLTEIQKELHLIIILAYEHQHTGKIVKM